MRIKIIYALIVVLLVSFAIEGFLWTGKYYAADRHEENKAVENMSGGESTKETENKPEEKAIKKVGNVRYYQPYFSLGVSLSEPDPSILEKQDITANGYITLRGKMPFIYPISIRATYLESEDYESKDYRLYGVSQDGKFEVTIPLEFGIGKYEVTLFAPDRKEPNGDVEMVKAISFDLINEDFKKEVIEEIDMSGWKTYRNDELGLQFKYPSQMRIEPVPLDDASKEVANLQFCLKFFDEDEIYAFTWFCIYSDAGLTLNDWVSKKGANDNTFEMVYLGSYIARKYAKNEMNYSAIIYYIKHNNKIIKLSSTPERIEIKGMANSLIFDN